MSALGIAANYFGQINFHANLPLFILLLAINLIYFINSRSKLNKTPDQQSADGVNGLVGPNASDQ
ncbi:MAG TPA: hypothetical protein VGV14_17205 [Rhodanobacter sp.]|nr:hypothetical protein [Rhodanobacter sp.]